MGSQDVIGVRMHIIFFRALAQTPVDCREHEAALKRVENVFPGARLFWVIGLVIVC